MQDPDLTPKFQRHTTWVARVILVEGLKHDVMTGNPRPLLWAVPLPVDQVMPASAPPVDIQNLLDAVCQKSHPLSEPRESRQPAGTRPTITASTCEMWKVGWTFMDAGGPQLLSRGVGHLFIGGGTQKTPDVDSEGVRGSGVFSWFYFRRKESTSRDDYVFSKCHS